MFSSLRQGSLVYILDKTNGIEYKIGTVVNATEPKTDYSQNFNLNSPSFIDIEVSTDTTSYSFKKIPSGYSIVNYDNNKVVLSETKEGIIPEVEAVLYNSEKVVNEIDYYKKNIVSCKDILKKVSPQFAKEQERDTEIANLKAKVSDVDNKLDKILNVLGNKE